MVVEGDVSATEGMPFLGRRLRMKVTKLTEKSSNLILYFDIKRGTVTFVSLPLIIYIYPKSRSSFRDAQELTNPVKIVKGTQYKSTFSTLLSVPLYCECKMLRNKQNKYNSLAVSSRLLPGGLSADCNNRCNSGVELSRLASLITFGPKNASHF